MSVVLFLLGALSVVAGVGMLGFGIPVKEFSFGNTLILSGVTAIVGGFIVVGLGTLVAQLQRVGEMLGARQLPRSARPLETFEFQGADARPGQPANRIPFPPKQPRADQRTHLSENTNGNAGAFGSQSDQMLPPILQNPDVGSDDAPLSPREFPPMPASARQPVELAEPSKPLSPPPSPARAMETTERDAGAAPALSPAASALPPPASPLASAWRAPHSPPISSPFPPPASPMVSSPMPPRQAPPAQFDAMWPAPPRQQDDPDANGLPKPMHSERVARTRSDGARPIATEPPKPASRDETRAIAILKSGVVDGMGYTLYVDGSIEAELPQGSVRFASINDLRTHLENS